MIRINSAIAVFERGFNTDDSIDMFSLAEIWYCFETRVCLHLLRAAYSLFCLFTSSRVSVRKLLRRENYWKSRILSGRVMKYMCSKM